MNIGIPVIDNQHRRIADYINDLDRAQETAARSDVSRILDLLIDYSVNHFSFEEQLLEEAGYNFLPAHQKVHQLFARKIADYKQRFSEGQDIGTDLLEMLKRWLVNHIKVEDMDYMELVKPVASSDQKKGWIAGLLTKVFG